MKQRTFIKCILVPIMAFSILPIAGCSNLPFAKPTVTVTVYPTIRPPRPTRTPSPSPTSTALPTNTPTITSTATLPPPQDDFSQAKLYSSGPRPGWEFAFTILLPEEIKGDYNAEVGDPPKPFVCRPLIEYAHPDRLYCTGRIPQVDENLLFKVIEKTTGQVVFKGYVFSPLP